MASEAASPDRTAGAAGPSTERGDAAWPRRRVLRLSARGVLVLAALLSAILLSLIVSCGINDRTISEDRGEAVAEVMETSLTRTVVRFSTPDGGVHIPEEGVLYPAGLQKGQAVRVEYDRRNPDLVRVAGRDLTLSLLPVLSTLAGVWAVLVPIYWLMRRAARRAAGPPVTDSASS